MKKSFKENTINQLNAKKAYCIKILEFINVLTIKYKYPKLLACKELFEHDIDKIDNALNFLREYNQAFISIISDRYEDFFELNQAFHTLRNLIEHNENIELIIQQIISCQKLTEMIKMKHKNKEKELIKL